MYEQVEHKIGEHLIVISNKESKFGYGHSFEILEEVCVETYFPSRDGTNYGVKDKMGKRGWVTDRELIKISGGKSNW